MRFYESLWKFIKVYESLWKFMKVYESLWKFMKVHESLWKLTKVNENYNIPRYFLCKITHFHSVLFNCNALLAFRDFIPWQMKFFCLLLYHFAFSWHWQIFCNRQMKGNSPNIADTYFTVQITWDLIFVNLFLAPIGNKFSSQFYQKWHFGDSQLKNGLN